MGSELGQTLRQLRKGAGYTLEQVAKAADVSPAALSLFETGKRNPSPKVLGLIAAALNSPVEPLQQLLDEERSAGRLEEAQFWFDSSEPAQRKQRARPSAGSPPNVNPGTSVNAGMFSRRPIEDLFATHEEIPMEDVSPFMPVHAAPGQVPFAPVVGQLRVDSPEYTRDLRNLATQREDNTVRYEAIERLGDQASLALRTLRGLVSDEDYEVAREAKRILRELGVDVPAEQTEPDEG